MRRQAVFGFMGKKLALAVVALPLLFAPVTANAQLATVVLNKISAAFSIANPDFAFFTSIIKNDMDSAPEIAATAVMIRPDLAADIAFYAAEANPAKALEIAGAMAAACPSCSGAILACLGRTNGGQGYGLQGEYEVAINAETGIENPSEQDIQPIDDEFEGVDAVSPSQPSEVGSSGFLGAIYSFDLRLPKPRNNGFQPAFLAG